MILLLKCRPIHHSGSLLVSCKPCLYAAVEAPHPFKTPFTSMWSLYEVYESLHMQWMGKWNYQQPDTTASVDPDVESWLKSWVTAELQTIPLSCSC